MIHHININRLRALVSASLLLVATVTPLLLSSATYADAISTRSLTLLANGLVEGSTPGGVVKHKFDFTMPATGTWQSIKLLYCTNADVGENNCVTPTGLDTTSATLDDETGSGLTGATLDNSVNGAPYLYYASGQSALFTQHITIGGITNPTTNNETFYVRLLAYSGNDGTGSIINSGTVSASTARPIVLSGVMPESLVFCAGATITKTASVPDCTTATSGAVSFNQLFSSTATSYATSQMSASTNAGSGYAISVNGPTLTSGSYTIPAMASATQSAFGVGQFGLNLVRNDQSTAGYGNAPTIDAYDTFVASADIDLASNTTNLRGQPTADYATNGVFKFLSGDTIADSGDSVLGPTDAQIYTVSYIANVAGSQAPGTYTTTLQYICTPTF